MQVKDKHRNRRGTVVLAVVCVLLQVMLSPNIGMGNGHVDFCIIFAGVYALLVGGRPAVIAGFVAGMVSGLLSSGPVGLMALLLTVFSYVIGIEERNRFVDGYVTPLSSFGVGSLVVILAYHLSMMMIGDSGSLGDMILQRTLPTFAITFVGFLPFAVFEVHASGKARGRKGAGKSLGANHYDIRDL